jgi:hypothetical protein
MTVTMSASEATSTPSRKAPQCAAGGVRAPNELDSTLRDGSSARPAQIPIRSISSRSHRSRHGCRARSCAGILGWRSSGPLAASVSGFGARRPVLARLSGHGTHVSGTVGGAVYGVAKAVALHPVRVLDCNGLRDRGRQLERGRLHHLSGPRGGGADGRRDDEQRRPRVLLELRHVPRPLRAGAEHHLVLVLERHRDEHDQRTSGRAASRPSAYAASPACASGAAGLPAPRADPGDGRGS